MLDYLLVNGRYPDFEKGELVQANIGLSEGKIAYVGPDSPAAEETVDCGGKIVSPGFIDIHMHEEWFEEGRKWIIANYMVKQGVTLGVGGNCGEIHQPVAEFRGIMADLGGCPINYALFSGYNTYRNVKLGYGHYDKAGKKVWDEIGAFVREDLKNGACGISFGIEYDPGMTTEEVIYGAGASDNEHLLVAAHYRADGEKSVEAIREMIEIQSNINKRFQISHLSSCSAMGTMRESLSIINEAMGKDPRLNYDTYPYNAFCTNLGSTVFEDGCLEDWGKDYSDILLTFEPYKNQFATRESFEDSRARFPDQLAVAFVMNEEEIRDAMTNPNGMIASDGTLRGGNGHPRAAGTFPRVLGKYVRDEDALPLIDALRKMTLEPAKRLELENRKGQILEGADGDITVFDPDTITDGPSFIDLDIPNQGIEAVFVNGKMAVRSGLIVNGKAGDFIDRKLSI